MNWLVENWAYIGCGVFALYILATVIVALTKNKSDDSVMGKITDFLGKYVSFIMTDKQKKLLEIAKEILDGDISVEEAKKQIENDK